jgi:hypothetical protein
MKYIEVSGDYNHCAEKLIVQKYIVVKTGYSFLASTVDRHVDKLQVTKFRAIRQIIREHEANRHFTGHKTVVYDTCPPKKLAELKKAGMV